VRGKPARFPTSACPLYEEDSSDEDAEDNLGVNPTSGRLQAAENMMQVLSNAERLVLGLLTMAADAFHFGIRIRVQRQDTRAEVQDRVAGCVAIDIGIDPVQGARETIVAPPGQHIADVHSERTRDHWYGLPLVPIVIPRLHTHLQTWRRGQYDSQGAHISMRSTSDIVGRWATRWRPSGFQQTHGRSDLREKVLRIKMLSS